MLRRFLSLGLPVAMALLSPASSTVAAPERTDLHSHEIVESISLPGPLNLKLIFLPERVLVRWHRASCNFVRLAIPRNGEDKQQTPSNGVTVTGTYTTDRTDHRVKLVTNWGAKIGTDVHDYTLKIEDGSCRLVTALHGMNGDEKTPSTKIVMRDFTTFTRCERRPLATFEEKDDICVNIPEKGGRRTSN